MNWQTIDSAPLDGEIVDLWIEFCGIKFRLTDYCYHDGDWWYAHEEVGESSVYASGYCPTHWMHRPAPPDGDPA